MDSSARYHKEAEITGGPVTKPLKETFKESVAVALAHVSEDFVEDDGIKIQINNQSEKVNTIVSALAESYVKAMFGTVGILPVDLKVAAMGAWTGFAVMLEAGLRTIISRRQAAGLEASQAPSPARR